MATSNIMLKCFRRNSHFDLKKNNKTPQPFIYIYSTYLTNYVKFVFPVPFIINPISHDTSGCLTEIKVVNML